MSRCPRANIGLKLKPKLRAPDIPRLARSVFVLSLGSISKGTHLGRYQPEPKLRRCAVGIVERLRGWLVLLVELRLCFSWDSDFREVSSWVNRSCQLEPKLKRKPCLTSCISSKLGFRSIPPQICAFRSGTQAQQVCCLAKAWWLQEC